MTSTQYSYYDDTPDPVTWKKALNLTKKYIDQFHELPSESIENEGVRAIAKWIAIQQDNYKNKTGMIMAFPKLYSSWGKFINSKKYKTYFKSDDEAWMEMFEQLKQYVDKHGKLPPMEQQS